MCQCSLAGSCLRPYAQRALFTTVTVFLGDGPESNLSKMLECYTTSPYARHARSLLIKGSGVRLPDMAKCPDLQKVITLLSTCRQVVEPTMIPLPPSTSRISSLHIRDVSGTTLHFARIVRAFPSLTKLECAFGPVRKSSHKSLDRYFASASSPPRLLHLTMGDITINGLDTVLFPPEADLRLRSLAINYCGDASSWGSIVQRVGAQLEELSIIEIDIQPAYSESLLFVVLSCYIYVFSPSDP